MCCVLEKKYNCRYIDTRRRERSTRALTVRAMRNEQELSISRCEVVCSICKIALERAHTKNKDWKPRKQPT